jgi:mono/diheme cytochrome c family protein
MEIGTVHYAPGHGSAPRLFEPGFLAVLAGIALIVAGTTYFVFNVLMYVEPFSWMSDQTKLKPQERGALFKDGIGMRPPVPGTVARGFLPYAFTGQPDSAARYLLNPLAATAAVLERGKTKYLTFCSPCHGDFGGGDSRLQGQFPNPPTFHSDKVRGWPDGHIYHVITEGQNVMPGYASQVKRDDRWAIIHYVRALQRARNPVEADLR